MNCESADLEFLMSITQEPQIGGPGVPCCLAGLFIISDTSASLIVRLPLLMFFHHDAIEGVVRLLSVKEGAH